VLCIFWVSSVWADQSVTATWQASPDPGVAGYFFYYGQCSTNWAFKVDVGTNSSYILHGLNEESTYYCSVTAYDPSSNESAPCDPVAFTTPSTGGLQLSPISNQILSPPQALFLTNAVTNPNALPGSLIFSLDSGSPQGMYINSLSGQIFWNPTLQQMGSSNLVVVRVSDTSEPPFTDTKVFNVVVKNAAQLNVDSTVVAVGGDGFVTLSSFCSGCVSNLNFELVAPEGWVSRLKINPLMTNFTIDQTLLGPADVVLNIQITDTNFFHGNQDLAQIYFTSTTGLTSAFGSISVSNLVALDPIGIQVGSVPGASSRLVFVGQDSLVEARVVNGLRQLVLYGPVGGNYQIQSSTNVSGKGPWMSKFSAQLTNLYQVFQLDTNNICTEYYRASSY